MKDECGTCGAPWSQPECDERIHAKQAEIEASYAETWPQGTKKGAAAGAHSRWHTPN